MDDRGMDGPSDDSSIGEAVSGRIQWSGAADNEDDGLFYIPERRPSLDLGDNPMDIGHMHYVDRAASPALSYTSLATDDGAVEMDDENGSYTRIQLERTDSYSSCYSLDSDDCEKRIFKDKSKHDPVPVAPDMPQFIQDPDEIGHPSLTVDFTFRTICNTLENLSEGALGRFKATLRVRHPRPFGAAPRTMDLVDLVDRLLEFYPLGVSLQITKAVLEEIGLNEVVTQLRDSCRRNEVRHDLSETLRRKYSSMCEDIGAQEEIRPLDEVYADLFITSTPDNGPNIEHEVIAVEKLDTNREAGRPLSTKDILSAESVEQSHTRLMLMTGVAGSGKSTAVRRLVLDWAHGRSHSHVSFLFPLTFRELQRFQGSTVSFLQIVRELYPAAQRLEDRELRCDGGCTAMYVFDGLDDYGGRLDFHNTELLGDPGDPVGLNVIVVNLLRGRLLHRGLFLVTGRPQVSACVPWDAHCTEIEVCGFRGDQKYEFFSRRFAEPDRAARVVEYVKSSATLAIMCHLPAFCSLVAGECQRLFQEQGPQAELPRGVTYLYTKLTLALAHRHCACSAAAAAATESGPEQERDFLMSLGKLALAMLEQLQFKIAKSDLSDAGIDEQKAVVHSGLCTEYHTKVHILFLERVMSFIHPTVQEYLAALYAFLSFAHQEKSVFQRRAKDKLAALFRGPTIFESYKAAVDRSLACADGRLDLFLRFLCGMAHRSNLELLGPLCVAAVNWPKVTDDVAALVRKRIQENGFPGRNDNLRRCLEELAAR